MKKLQKMELHSYQEMSDDELKRIVGGVEENETCSMQNGQCSGTCLPGLKWDSTLNNFVQVPRKCTMITTYGSPGYPSLSTCMCL